MTGFTHATPGSGSQVRVHVRLAPVPAGDPREVIAIERRVLRLEEPGGDRVSDFLFDGIFPETSKQDEVYASVAAPLVESLVQGVNSCCLAYGQTGSGKTHSIFGVSGSAAPDSDRGIAHRVVDDLMGRVEYIKASGCDVSVKGSFMEIYMNNVYNLGGDPQSTHVAPSRESHGPGSLREPDACSSANARTRFRHARPLSGTHASLREKSGETFGSGITTGTQRARARPASARVARPGAGTGFSGAQLSRSRPTSGASTSSCGSRPRDEPALEVLEDSGGTTVVRGLSKVRLHSESEAYAFIQSGLARRRTGATAMNIKSSRSHVILSLEVLRQTAPGSSQYVGGTLNLVDLAGSERIKKSESEGDRQREARAINASLSALGNVVRSLHHSSLGHLQGGHDDDGEDSEHYTGTTGDHQVHADHTQTNQGAHIPFRDCKLTRVLKDSLSGNSMTVLLATLFVGRGNYEECLNTLQFAASCTDLRTRPRVNYQQQQLQPHRRNQHAPRDSLNRVGADDVAAESHLHGPGVPSTAYATGGGRRRHVRVSEWDDEGHCAHAQDIPSLEQLEVRGGDVPGSRNGTDEDGRSIGWGDGSEAVERKEMELSALREEVTTLRRELASLLPAEPGTGVGDVDEIVRTNGPDTHRRIALAGDLTHRPNHRSGAPLPRSRLRGINGGEDVSELSSSEKEALIVRLRMEAESGRHTVRALEAKLAGVHEEYLELRERSNGEEARRAGSMREYREKLRHLERSHAIELERVHDETQRSESQLRREVDRLREANEALRQQLDSFSRAHPASRKASSDYDRDVAEAVDAVRTRIDADRCRALKQAESERERQVSNLKEQAEFFIRRKEEERKLLERRLAEASDAAERQIQSLREEAEYLGRHCVRNATFLSKLERGEYVVRRRGNERSLIVPEGEMPRRLRAARCPHFASNFPLLSSASSSCGRAHPAALGTDRDSGDDESGGGGSPRCVPINTSLSVFIKDSSRAPDREFEPNRPSDVQSAAVDTPTADDVLYVQRLEAERDKLRTLLLDSKRQTSDLKAFLKRQGIRSTTPGGARRADNL